MASEIKVSGEIINFGTINNILLLEGNQLLDEVTQVLHQHFKTFSTSIVEIDKLHYNARTLSHSSIRETFYEESYQLQGTPCEHVVKSEQLFFLYPSDLQGNFPSDTSISQHNIMAYLGIPLRAKSGEVLGILASKFQHQLIDAEMVIHYHQILANVVVHGLRIKWLTERSDYLVNQLSYEVSHDNLTGLMNRSCLSDKLETLTNSTLECFTLAYLDIDNFKHINDAHGNYIGDQIIKHVAKVVAQNVPETHLVFRIAGDEYAFITFSNDPLEICKKINEQLQSGYSDSSRHIKLSVSFGLARKAEQHINPDQLILNASLALKSAKQSSSQHTCCYDTQLSVQYYRRNMIIEALRYALESTDDTSNQIYVVLQPIVKKNVSDWSHFEVLARWKNDTLGDISPIEFIEAAEESGLIKELGERIVELACMAKQQFEAKLGYKMMFSLNCSAHQLSAPSQYLEHLTSTIRRFGFYPHEFTIELTETVLLTKTNQVESILGKLRTLGFKVALDDFGTGYSSLNYIHSYPIDCIKIDATFIRNMLHNQTSERVVWLIIQLAKQLNVELVAEGVEDEKALEKLHAMGCEQIQGFYYSQPKATQEMIDILSQKPNKKLCVING
ncbi:EAL domain-containing protein [Vibrio sp. S4M6]|uniref:putative bifunctional diguanylate cyclase/phosphodiesterase n=1 Tax=Vibrio sinus TaxID=2946865 RepID=UPI002029BBA7|nr:GGDEF domain-containing phosphodiesterase [Vibrio sinus]MCL9780279.1 EAL domain-containing protein [Vibrio sinus]